MSDIKTSATPCVPKPNFNANSSGGTDLKTTPINRGNDPAWSPAKGIITTSSQPSPIKGHMEDTKP